VIAAIVVKLIFVIPRLLFSLIVAGSVCLHAQEGSLADAAKASRGATKSKIVVTDENLVSSRGPFPDMNIDGVDNSEEIAKSMIEFRKAHGAPETERLIHDWYDRYDLLFQKAFEETKAIKSRAQDSQTHPPEYIYQHDYRKQEELQDSIALSQLQQLRTVQKNGLLIARIQQTFQKVRNAISVAGMRYEWMKIRFGNGNGSW
jgi:hypothetical protein